MAAPGSPDYDAMVLLNVVGVVGATPGTQPGRQLPRLRAIQCAVVPGAHTQAAGAGASVLGPVAHRPR